MVLAHSLWKNRPATLVAGIAYGLHPLLLAHLGLFGHQPSITVTAATPWLVICVLKALRGAGRKWVAVSGLLAAFCVLEMGEHIYGLIVLCGCLFVIELARAHRRGGARAVRAIFIRAAAVGALTLGVIAYWMLPLFRLSGSFVLTPPQLARYTLTSDIGARLGKQPDYFLQRLSGIHRVITFNTVDIFDKGSFYLGWVCVALTVVTIVAIARRRDNGTLSAILIASLLALWTSTGGIAYASGSLASAGLLPWLVVGLVGGLTVGGFIRHLDLGRAGTALGIAAAVAFFGVPYVAPFLGLQSYVPLIVNLRFPRLYPIATLGLALGTAYPVVLVSNWARERHPSRAPMLVPAVTFVVIIAVLVDAAPYRALFDLRAPDPTKGYREATAALAAAGDQSRVAASIDPRVVDQLLHTGRDQSTGWPHPVASPEMFHLALEALYTPPGFRDSALGLSSTGYYVVDPAADPIKGTGRNAPISVDDLSLQRNPKVLPMIRSYDDVVVVKDTKLAPDLAVALSQRHIGVVTGGPDAARQLGDATRAVVPAASACSAPRARRPTEEGEDGVLSDEVASACAMNRWVGHFVDSKSVGLGSGTGAIFTLPRPGLKGITVWLDRAAGATELDLREVGPDGRSLGRLVAHSTSTTLDENEMSYFPLNPETTSAGQRYVFLLSCPVCVPGTEPHVIQSSARTDQPGDLVQNGEIRADKVVGFSLLYDRVDPVDPPSNTLQGRRTSPGHWVVDSSGDRPSLLVVGESWFPGWTVHVDGRSVSALKADGAFVGVALPAGSHHVTLSYDPPPIAFAGRAISGATLALAVAMLLPWSQRRRRRGRGTRPVSEPAMTGAAEQPLVSSGP
jgi:hypothetical protein